MDVQRARVLTREPSSQNPYRRHSCHLILVEAHRDSGFQIRNISKEMAIPAMQCCQELPPALMLFARKGMRKVQAFLGKEVSGPVHEGFRAQG